MMTEFQPHFFFLLDFKSTTPGPSNYKRLQLPGEEKGKACHLVAMEVRHMANKQTLGEEAWGGVRKHSVLGEGKLRKAC